MFVQAGLVAVLLLTESFERVMAYTGFTLNLMSLLTVLGVFVLRRREPALQRQDNLSFHPVDDDKLLFFRRAGRPGEADLLVVVNLDPHAVRWAYVEVPLAAMAATPLANSVSPTTRRAGGPLARTMACACMNPVATIL